MLGSLLSQWKVKHSSLVQEEGGSASQEGRPKKVEGCSKVIQQKATEREADIM